MDPVGERLGMNINQQSNIVFATLFTYAADGSPQWLVLSEGREQPDGSFSGTLYRTSGPAFGANPWSPTGVTLAAVGTMRIAFTNADNATLTYTLDGVAVTKNIERQRFASPGASISRSRAPCSSRRSSTTTSRGATPGTP
ncbi:MAG: hypothetical protein IPJ28_05325 [Betaproteobacteria bacterium]|nr:hypothetical protein [Betaproteobacteria bacterium]